MENLNLETRPTGRSPKGKYYFGEKAVLLCKDRPKDCQVGMNQTLINYTMISFHVIMNTRACSEHVVLIST